VNLPRGTRIAVVVGIFLFALSMFGLAFLQRSRFVRDTEDRQRIEGQISALYLSIQSQSDLPRGREAVVEDGPREESAFLALLRRAAQTSGARIRRWNAQARPPQPGVTVDPPSDVLKDVTPLIGTLEASGPYRSVIAFTRRLETGDRLLSLSNVSWSRPAEGQDVLLVAQITRYVVPASAPPAQAATENTHDAPSRRFADARAPSVRSPGPRRGPSADRS
jgi:hypothetical protein